MAIASTPRSDDRIPPFLRASITVACLVVGPSAAVLFLLPETGADIWAWSPAPFNARYIGAVYCAALLPLLVFATTARWNPGWMLLWMAFAFTTSIGVVMFFHSGEFEWGRPATYAFWFLYIFFPVNLVVHLKRHWVDQPPRATTDRRWTSVATAFGAVLGIYGALLLVIPEDAAGFWPWPVDAFHGRIYAATFLTPGVGFLVVRASASQYERLTLGATLMTLGGAAVLGLLLANADVPDAARLDPGDGGLWAFIAMNVVSIVAGLVVIGGPWARDAGSPRPYEARS